jgi:hypothetical protein
MQTTEEVIAGITKTVEITVAEPEPVASTYKFSYEVPADVVAGQEVEVPVTFKTDVKGDIGYEGVRFKFTAQGPGDVTFKAVDSNEVEHTFTNEGYWGPPGGFDLPAEYEATTDWTLVFSAAGEYTITFSLIDADTEEVIAGITKTVEITVAEPEPVASTYKFSYEVPADVVAGQEVEVPVTFKTDVKGDIGYEGVRFKFTAQGPGDVTFKAVDSNEVEHTFTNEGYWGPPGGFDLPAEYEATTDWTLVFSAAGEYTITFSLIDAATEEVIAGITKTVEITVAEPEPVASTYKFSYEVPADVVAGQEVEVPVTFKTDVKGDIGYEGVRFKFTAQGPGDVTFKAVDSNEVEHTFTNEGYWGPPGGFDLPAEYEATTDWTLVFSAAGEYTITFSLIDADTEEVIAGITETVEITVAEPEPVASTYKFSYEVPADVVAGQEVEVPVTFKTDVKGDIGYEGVRFKFAAEGPGDVTFKAVDSNEVEHTFTNEGYWGPPGGFDLPAEYEATTDWTLVFSEAGKYTITFSLIDAATGDVIAGITETVEITVAEPEPVASTYKFSYEVPADVVAGQEVEVPVTFKTDVKGDIGYEGVRFKFTAQGPGDVTFKAVDSNEVEHTFTNEGYWGPPGGFDLPAEYEATTDWTLVFSAAGEYTITFSLIDADTEEVIAGITETVEITVAEPEPVASTYKFSYEVPADVVAGQEVEVPVTFKTDVKGDIGYEGVRFKFAAEGPGDVTFKAVDSNEVEHTFTNEGYWGPPGGFDLPAEYEATTDWTLVFSEAGKYTITFSLIDAATGDVIAGITETVEITVAEPEPVASTYKFSYEVPADVVAGQEVEVPVTFKTDVKGDIGYEGVRFKFTAQGPGDVTFKAVDSNEVEHTFTNEGYWGPPGGFDLPAEYEATTDWTLVFSAAGEYTITFSLIDADTEEVIAGITETVEITVAEPEPVASTYKFSYEVPADVVAGQEVEVPVTFKTDVKGDIGYEGVRFKFAAEGPGDVTFKAVDSNEVEHTFTNEGYWGPPGGFDLPAEYEATTDWTLVFSEAGKYTITFSLIDAATGDVIAGITETVEITVAEPEPVASTYKFSYEVPADVVAGQEVEVPVTFKTDVKGDIGYEGVRFKFTAQGPGDVTFKAVDSNEVEHTFTNEGYWGPPGGFDLPAEYEATTDWTLVFSEAGKYTITFSLIDAATGDVIAGITETVEITVAEPEPVASTYKFSYEVPADVVAGQEVEVPVTFKTDVKGDIGYEGVRFKFTAQGPGDVTFKAVDSNEVEHTFTNEGYWGPTGGFELPAEYEATTDWTLVFSEAGKYTITFSLIDAATGDVIAGITETVEITVAEPEPVASTYKFSYEVPADVVAGQEVEVPVTFKTDVKGDIGYEGVRFKFTAQGPGDVTFKAVDSNEVEHTFTNEGYWGPTGGFELPAEYEATTDWTLVFSEAGKYTITFSLIDAATGDVIAGITETVEITVAEPEPVASTYKFSYEVPADVVAGQEVEVPVTFKTDVKGDIGYEGVRFKFAAEGPGDVTFKAVDSNEVEHTFTNEGYWGPTGGFELPAEYEATTDWTLVFSEAGKYTITFSLIDAATGDVIAGITETVEITVAEPEPVASTYKFSYEVPADVVAGQEVEVPVTFKTDVKGDIGYEGVRFKFTAQGPGDVTFKAVDSNEVEHTFTNEGYWGPTGGFELPAEYEATTDWTLVFSEAGKYTITFSLIDAATGDVIAGITETVEITVAEPEPVASTYKFSYEVPADVVAGQEVEVPVTFKTDVKGDIGYEGVRFKFTAQGPGDVTFKAVDSNEVEHTFTNEGYWGPPGGFDLPAEYEATTDWTLVFSAAGEYTITFSLIDADTEEVIAGITETVEITVAEPEPVASTYKFSYEVPADVVAGQEVEVPVTFKTDVKGDIGYEGVRFKFTAQGPGDVTFKAVDSNEVEHTFTNEGYWGPTGGFELPAEYEATTDWTLVFSEAGKYTITFSLIDAATGDVIAGITETVEITVAEPEPVASTYKFSYEVPADVVAGQEVEVPVTFKTDVKGDIGYEGVRFKFAAEGPGDVTFKAVDSNEVEHTFTNEGYWGPTGGFELPAEYEATTDWTLVFSEAGKYTITFSLIDAATGDVIAGITETVEITVAEPEPVASTYKFSYEVPADVVAGQEVEVPVTFKTDVKGDIGYEGVRFKFTAQGPGDVTFKAVDSNEVEHTFTNEGYWGPTGGFELPAEYEATTDWTLVFSEAGKYTITFSLIDAATGDVIAGITETVEITVAEPEPVASTYKFSYEVPADVVAGQEVEVPVTFKTDVKGDIGYEGVRFKFTAQGPGDVTFKAVDSNEVEHTFTNEGYWGPPGGFDLPAEYEATTDWTLVFSAAGEYTITFSLIDADTEEVIAGITETVEITVAEPEPVASTYKFSYEVPADVVAGQEVEVPVTFKTDVKGDIGYEGVRFKFTAQGPGDVTFKAVDSNEVEHTFTNEGYWGPPGGFDLPAEYEATTDWTLVFSAAGEYTITFSLIDAATGDVIAGITETVEITVAEPG